LTIKGINLFLLFGINTTNIMHGLNIINTFNASSYHENRIRVMKFKRMGFSKVKPNFILELIRKEISYEEYLKYQDQWRRDECQEKFIFDDPVVFKSVYKQLCQEGLGSDDSDYALEHETEHISIAQNIGIESYYAINFNVIKCDDKSMDIKINPEAIAFIEKTALDNKWQIEKYLTELARLYDTANPSEKDKQCLNIIKEIISTYDLNIDVDKLF